MTETPTIFSGAVTAAVRFNETCLEIPDGLEYADWEELGAKLQRANRSLSWWVGDWVRFGERRYGEKYSQAVQETGKEYETVRAMAWVADRFEMLRRRSNLSFGHHREVAAPPDHRGIEAFEIGGSKVVDRHVDRRDRVGRKVRLINEAGHFMGAHRIVW